MRRRTKAGKGQRFLRMKMSIYRKPARAARGTMTVVDDLRRLRVYNTKNHQSITVGIERYASLGEADLRRWRDAQLGPQSAV
jgi:hypothetical protein